MRTAFTDPVGVPHPIVGSFEKIRSAAEITRQIVADCEQRIRDLAQGVTP